MSECPDERPNFRVRHALGRRAEHPLEIRNLPRRLGIADITLRAIAVDECFAVGIANRNKRHAAGLIEFQSCQGATGVRKSPVKFYEDVVFFQ